MQIQFFYQNQLKNYKYEELVFKYASAVSTIIELPDLIQVCLYDLGSDTYGGIDRYKINRIGLHYDLLLEQVPNILVHELIHVNQKLLGTLKIKQSGWCFWHSIPYTKKSPDKMTKEEYENLPWELDVVNRHPAILAQAKKLIL